MVLYLGHVGMSTLIVLRITGGPTATAQTNEKSVLLGFSFMHLKILVLLMKRKVEKTSNVLYRYDKVPFVFLSLYL